LIQVKRHIFILSIIVVFATSCQQRQADDKLSRPNFLILLADDLGYGDVSFTNPKALIETPNLDKLAASGAILTDCYSASSMCSPSRAGLLTGRTPTRIGIHDWIKEIYKKPYSNVHLPVEETTIAEILQSVGYQTAVIGKWHLNNAFRTGNHSDPDDHGFKYWFSTAGQSEPTHRNPDNFFENGDSLGQIGTPENPEFSSAILADKAISWLNERQKEIPFFLYIPFHEPHVVCDAPDILKEKYLSRISGGDIPLLDQTGEKGLGQAEYYACVENMDLAIGRILEALKQEDILNNTWIFFSSDNGPDTGRKYQGRLQSVGDNGPFRGRKRWILDGGIHQASILVKPGTIEAGSKISVPIGHVDLLPTICDITGLEIPKVVIDGCSILPVIESGLEERPGSPLHWHFYSPRGDSPQSVLRKGDWVITANWNTKRPAGRFNLDYIEMIKSAKLVDFQLYNIRHDPSQTNPLNLQKPTLYKEMKEMLIEVHTEVQDECPNKTKFSSNEETK
jgi:arylsulfatase A